MINRYACEVIKTSTSKARFNIEADSPEEASRKVLEKAATSTFTDTNECTYI
jgi:hypothetical protein